MKLSNESVTCLWPKMKILGFFEENKLTKQKKEKKIVRERVDSPYQNICDNYVPQ